ncbi:MAG: hypothetical protein JSS70_02915 [Bacteroidetes bacterium]|nr:hypothetical protein [Bacteroidota bacterium]
MTTNFTYKNSTYMKRFLQISAMAFVIMLSAGLRNTVSAQPAGDVSYQDFYDELSPYGRWIDYPEYGYVWCPDEGADFRPYSTNGHWVWNDDYEWMWVSDYSWGWAPFHYGRWFYDDMYGWMWMPGYEWSPAWVAWRSGGDYYGWAPLRPGFSISIGFSSYSPPYNYWCFTPSRYITSPRVYDYCVSPRQNMTIINNTTIINNYNYNRNVFVTGPRRMDVERYTNSRINPVQVRDISRPGRAGYRNNEVSIYRPSVQRENNNRGFAPRQFDEYRGNNRAFRNEDRADRTNVFNDRTERNNTRFENRNNDSRNIFNNERMNRENNQRVENDNGRFQQRNNFPQDNQRRFDQRGGNSNIDWGNNRNEQIQQRNNDNAIRERSVRDIFGKDNRQGFDQPVQQNHFERQEPVRNNDNFNRREWDRQQPQQQPVQNENFSRRNMNMDNGNRGFSNAPTQPQQRRDVFNNREINQPQQQRQSFPEMRRQEQPTQFARPTNGGNNSAQGGWGRGRRG